MDQGFIVTRPYASPGALTGGRHVLVKNAEYGIPEAVKHCCVHYKGELIDPWIYDPKATIEAEREAAANFAAAKQGIPNLRRADVKRLLGTDDDLRVNACVDHLGFPKGSLVHENDAGNWIGKNTGSHEEWDGRAVADWVEQFVYVFPNSPLAKRR